MKSLVHASAGVSGSARCRRKFLHYFRKGFYDAKYVSWERGYKWDAHQEWERALNRDDFENLLHEERYTEIAAHAVRIESRTNLLFSFEKMALRDAVRTPEGARTFSCGLHQFLHGRSKPERRFDDWCEVVASLPRRQTRVLTWPVVTIFGFLAQPKIHFFLKPNVTRRGAEKYGFDFLYCSKPLWSTYSSLIDFTAEIKHDLADLRPRDMIDLQSFVWVQGSDEYP